MAIYLRKFENHASYEEARQNLILPNVSYCVNENEVHYNPYVDPYAGHDYVDLGLPSGTKWATMNVGASSETDYGNYYQYGKGSAQFAATSGQSDYTGGENPLAASADTATVVWGGQWHMPTSAQCRELIDSCIWAWDASKKGYTITKNNKSIFLPACGVYLNGNFYNDQGYYLTSTSSFSGSKAYYMVFSYDRHTMFNDGKRNTGYSIRPVVG